MKLAFVWRSAAFFCALAGLFGVIGPTAAADAPAPLKVLFLGDTGHHDPAARFQQLQPVMAARGIALEYTGSLDDLNPTKLAGYDCLVIYANWTNITTVQEQALLDFVAKGGGFVPLHCASYCFLNSPKCIELVGAQFSTHDTGVFKETIVRPEHPVEQGVSPIESWDETYVHTRHNTNRVVLAERRDANGAEPYTWVREHGKGRVFYTAWGHDERTWSNPNFQALVERGIRWAAANSPRGREGTESFSVSIQVDAGKTTGEWKPIWRFFGADEPNYATMSNGEKLIGELGALDPGKVYFRAHNLLTSGDGTPAPKWGSTGAYSEDAQGNPVYNWKIVDGIFDTYLKHGVRPYAEIGFMPKEMSIHPDPYQHDWKPGDDYGRIYTGWTYPPKDYDKWRELVFQWVKHCVDKYGKAEVEKWYWEVWNEPDIGYWRGQPRIPTFLKLHDYAIDGVRRALPTARVGGPDLAGGGGDFMRQFLEHCLRGTNYATGQVGTPMDFMSFHAKGGTTYTNGHVRMSAGNHLRIASGVYRLMSQFPEVKDKPIVIGESDPDGCAACDANVYPANRYRNRAQFASYSAAVFSRQTEVAERAGMNLEGALTWSFEFEGQPAFDGFRTLASDGIDKPVMSAFRIMSQLSGKKVAAESNHGIDLDEMMRRGVRTNADVSARATLDGKKLCVMVWHYHDEDVPGPDADVEVTLDHLPLANGEAKLEHYQVDEEHSDAVTMWQKMGAPNVLTPAQHAELEKAGQLALLDGPKTVSVKDGKATVRFTLPRQGVALLKLTW